METYIIHCRPVCMLVSWEPQRHNIYCTHQCSNHDNPDGKPIPKTHKANFLVNSTSGSPKRFARLSVGVQLTYHNIRGVRDNSAEDTREVASGERDGGLGALVVVGLLAWEVMVDSLDNVLKRGELHHGVRNLSAPEGIQALVQPELISMCLRRVMLEVR